MNLPVEVQNVRRRGIFHRPLSSAFVRLHSLTPALIRLHPLTFALTRSQFALIRSYLLLCTLIGSYTLLMI